MRNKIKLSTEQIKAMYDYLTGKAFKNKKKKEDLQFLYHSLTPNKVYVKYTVYGLEDDGSIYSENNLVCINPNGKVMDCENDFNNIKERMAFEYGLIEIDLDANANVVFK